MQIEEMGNKVLETWDAAELSEAWIAGAAVIIDVRSPQEFMHEHIPGSLLIPMSSFDGTKLPDEAGKRIVLMCAGGVRSERMARAALEAGLDRIAHLGGGFGAWKGAGLGYTGTDFASGAPKRVPPRAG